jgi:hypothetical protein
MQSYVSRAFLYFAPVSKKVLILVDNQPWMTSKQPRSARLWQFMITKVPACRTLVYIIDDVPRGNHVEKNAYVDFY